MIFRIFFTFFVKNGHFYSSNGFHFPDYHHQDVFNTFNKNNATNFFIKNKIILENNAFNEYINYKVNVHLGIFQAISEINYLTDNDIIDFFSEIVVFVKIWNQEIV